MASQSMEPRCAVQGMLEGASSVIRHARFCWLVTNPRGSNPAVRPMGQIVEASDDLQVRFITDGRSRKAEDIRNNGDVQLLFSRETDDAFVTLAGEALVVTDREVIDARWRRAYSNYFPTAEDRLHAAFIEVRPRMLKLWIRGVTPEPYGFRPTVLICGGGAEWTEEAAQGR